MWSWVADGPERSWVTWSGGRGRSAVAVFRHRGGCRWASRGLPFLVALGAGGTGGAALRRAVRWPPPVTPSPSPRRVALRAPADHNRGRMMAGGRDRVLLPQRREPVLRTPSGCVCRVDRDHREARVCGHLDEPTAEFPGRDARNDRPISAAPLSAASPVPGPLTAELSRFGEAEIFHRDRGAVAYLSSAKELGDGVTEPAVALADRQSCQLEGDGERWADGVAVGGDYPGGKVAVVQIDGQQRAPAQVVQAGHWPRYSAPAGV